MNMFDKILISLGFSVGLWLFITSVISLYVGGFNLFIIILLSLSILLIAFSSNKIFHHLNRTQNSRNFRRDATIIIGTIIIAVSTYRFTFKQVPNDPSDQLFYAAEVGDKDILYRLKNVNKMDFYKVDNEGNTPLHYGVLKDDPNLMAALLNKNTNNEFVNHKNIQGLSALDQALLYKKWKSAYYLIKNGADYCHHKDVLNDHKEPEGFNPFYESLKACN